MTILGSGFTGATSVTFGGAGAATFTVNSPNRITATPPAVLPAAPPARRCPPPASTPARTRPTTSARSRCRSRQLGTGSAAGQILPPAEGPVTVNSLGVLVAPPGCGCEIAQAPTEYDYVPAPTITSVSTSTGGAANLASEKGGTVITVHGSGLDPLTIDWADFGDPPPESSMDTNYVFLTGTEMQITAPPDHSRTGPVAVPFSVKTLGGQSAPATVTYAGIPEVTAVVNTVEQHRTWTAPTALRTPAGPRSRSAAEGFAGQLIAPIEFTDTESPFSVGTQYTFTVTAAPAPEHADRCSRTRRS